MRLAVLRSEELSHHMRMVVFLPELQNNHREGVSSGLAISSSDTDLIRGEGNCRLKKIISKSANYLKLELFVLSIEAFDAECSPEKEKACGVQACIRRVQFNLLVRG